MSIAIYLILFVMDSCKCYIIWVFVLCVCVLVQLFVLSTGERYLKNIFKDFRSFICFVLVCCV